MAVNKVVYGSMTLVDLTTDTVTADTLAIGVTAHDKAGNAITGTLVPENLDDVLTEQDSIIDQIQAALEGKASVSITEDDLTPELLQSFDPDFKAENIAEGVELFGLVGSFAGGGKIATGTVTTNTATNMGQYTHTLTVTGLNFLPAHTVLIATSSSSVGTYRTTGAYDATLYYSGGTKTATYSVTESGFSYRTTGSYRYDGMLEGTYTWIAWSE